MIPRFPTLVVLTLGLAPYRFEYFVRLAEYLKKRLQLVILRRSPEVANYRWSSVAKAADFQLITVSSDPSLKQRQHQQTTLRKGFLQNPPTLRQIREMCRWHPALLYSSEASFFSWPALLASLLAGIPLILETDMGPATQARLSPLKRFNQRLFRKRASLIIGRTMDCLAYGRKTVFAPHAVSAALFRPAPRPRKRHRREPTFLFVGVPSHTKGLDLFAKAAARARQDAVFACRLVGATPAQARSLTRVFRAAGFHGSLSFGGFLSGEDLLREYQQAEAFVFPSRFDTYGVVVHEAACCGLPVVVSCHAGASQNLVVEGQNGCVIDPENTEQFAARLIRLARDPRLRRRWGRESRRRGVAFSVEQQARKVSRRILQLLAKSPEPRTRPRL